jgi:ankyrin repeat protein
VIALIIDRGNFLINAAHRFRWVFCQLEVLRRTLPAHIRSTLKEMPKTLDKTYEQALLAIDGEMRQFAQRLFQCLSVSIRPLRVEELADILAVRFDEGELPKFNPDWRLGDAQAAVLSVCSNLISVVDVNGSQIVQFSHFSVKEFLTSNRLATAIEELSGYYIVPRSAHTILAQASLSVLLQLDDRIDRDGIKNFPFSSYAAHHWVEHGQFEGVSSAIQVAMEHLFNPDKPYFANWLWIYDMDDPWREETPTMHPERPPPATPIYYAVLCGFRQLIEHLITSYPDDVNVTGGYYQSPLLAALVMEDIDSALSLLKQGADVNVLDKSGRSPLHRATEGGRIDIADLLLTHDADINLPNSEGDSALSLASYKGEMEILRLFLQRGADVNSQNDWGWTPLYAASRSGHVNMAELLIQHGADVGSPHNEGRTPLHAASFGGHVKMAEWLIRYCADVGSRDNDGWTPLHQASSRGQTAVAELLIQRGADLCSRDDDSRTPLHVAARQGHLETVKFLLECGADRNIRDDRNKTPLDLASDYNKLDVANFLSRSSIALEEEVDPNTSSIIPQNLRPDVARSPQSPRGHVESSDDESSDDESPSMCTASANGKIDVVRSLLDHGSDIEERNSERRTPLALASMYGQVEVATLLTERGANVNSREPDGWTPLHQASRHGYLHIARLLLDHNADINALQRNQRTALDIAARNGYLEIVELLIERGANADVRNGYGRTPRQEALAYGYGKVAELLSKHGASP